MTPEGFGGYSECVRSLLQLTAKHQKGGDMRRFTKNVFVLCLAAVLVILPMASGYAGAADKNTGGEEGPSAGLMAADLVLARPLGIASTALGCVIFVASLPFSLPGGNSKAVFKTTVGKPAEFTFKRPLGAFE